MEPAMSIMGSLNSNFTTSAANQNQKANFDLSEQREFANALKQQLLVQTPLQVLLETMFTRLQSQAQMFHDLQDRVEYLEGKEAGSKELMLRMQLCEAKLEDLTSSSRVKQAEMFTRVDDLEKLAHVAAEKGREADALAHLVSGLEERITHFEGQLGHMEAGTSGRRHQGGGGGEADEEGGDEEGGLDAEASHRSEAGGDSPRTPRSAPGAPKKQNKTNLVVIGHRKPPSRGEGGADGRPSGSGNQTYSSRELAELQAKVHHVAEENKALTHTTQGLVASLTQLQAALDETRTSTSTHIKALEHSAKATKASLSDEVTSVKEVVQSFLAEPRVSHADFTQLQSRFESTAQEAKASTEAIEQIREEEIRTLNDSITELLQSAKKADDTAHTLLETHQRLSVMEAALEDIRSEVQIATTDALDGVAKLADLEDLARDVDGKASAQDIKQLAQQQAALAQSVNGMAEWLAVRPDNSDKATAGPPSLTKFKCLTCDQELKVKAGNAFAKSGLLPKLDGMHSPHSTIPGGPGLNIAEMRKLASAPNTRTGGQDFADYGAMDDSSTRRTKTTRTADGRVALQMPAGGLKLPPGAKTPVFLA